MAGSVSKRNQYRIFRIFEKGYYNSDKEYDAVFELIGINCFMPSDRKFIEETFKRLYKYYPNTFEECLAKCKEGNKNVCD